MRVGTIQGSSQAQKNRLLYETVKKYATGHEVVNFGCHMYEAYSYSYVEISVLIGLLIASGSVDFIVTGCSSGQGMMLACNSMPGVLCGYAPTPKDAYLFAQINNGNVISLPLGEDYTWSGVANFEATIEKLFSEPFGQGYPKSEAVRKQKDTKELKEIRALSQINTVDLIKRMDREVINTIMQKEDVVSFVLNNGRDPEISDWIRNFIDNGY